MALWCFPNLFRYFQWLFRVGVEQVGQSVWQHGFLAFHCHDESKSLQMQLAACSQAPSSADEVMKVLAAAVIACSGKPMAD